MGPAPQVPKRYCQPQTEPYLAWKLCTLLWVQSRGLEPGGPSGTQKYGPDEYCLVTDDVTCELICDSQALHVHDDMLKLLLHCKGVQRIALITDSASTCGDPPAEYAHITDVNFSRFGEIAGSRLTMDVAFRNVIQHAGIGVREAFLMASTNPARAVGLSGELGSIAVGKRADLVILSDSLALEQVIIGGEVYSKESNPKGAPHGNI